MFYVNEEEEKSIADYRDMIRGNVHLQIRKTHINENYIETKDTNMPVA